MAILRITIGSVTATKTIDDAKATTVTTAIYNNIVLPAWDVTKPLPTTAQERLQAVIDWLAINMRDAARDARLRQLIATQQESNATQLSMIDV